MPYNAILITSFSLQKSISVTHHLFHISTSDENIIFASLFFFSSNNFHLKNIAGFASSPCIVVYSDNSEPQVYHGPMNANDLGDFIELYSFSFVFFLFCIYYSFILL